MKFSLNKKINYFEINSEYHVNLSVLFKILQEAAIEHSHKVGLGVQEMNSKGIGWLLSRMGVKIFRYPKYREEIKVLTWSRRYKGIRAFRDYEIYSGDEKLAEISSQWVLVNIHNRKPLRISPELISNYKPEKGDSVIANFDIWKARKEHELKPEAQITTRYSDYDTNGHVNNSIYIEYLEDLITKKNLGEVKELKIQFSKEITMKENTINASLANQEYNSDMSHFFLFSQNELFANGEILLEKEN